MIRFNLAGIVTDVHVASAFGRSLIEHRVYWNLMPSYKNLRHLFLSMSPGASTLVTNVAKVLAASPGLRSLGLEIDPEGPYYEGDFDLLSEVVVPFEKFRKPGMRLQLEELKLGYRASDPRAPGYIANALSRLTDLSKLVKFEHLNRSKAEERGEERNVANLNYEILMQAKNLRSVSTYFCTTGFVALVEELSRIQPRKLQDLKIHIIDSKWRWSPCFQPLESLGGGWKKIHLGGRTSVGNIPDREESFREFMTQSEDCIEDLGIYATFCVRTPSTPRHCRNCDTNLFTCLTETYSAPWKRK
jgi:hypothetical protein